MTLHILTDCLDVTNNSYGNSLSSKFFIFNLNIVPFLFFAEDFHLLFVNLTLAS